MDRSGDVRLMSESMQLQANSMYIICKMLFNCVKGGLHISGGADISTLPPAKMLFLSNYSSCKQ